MSGVQACLHATVREALDGIGVLPVFSGAGRGTADARRIVFAALVATVARQRQRLDAAVSAQDWLATYRLDVSSGRHDAHGAFVRAEACFRNAPDSLDADAIIAAYEQSLTWSASASDARHSAGAYFTPPDIADRLLDAALAPTLREADSRGADALTELRVCDPACGPGVFLLAALRCMAPVLARCAGITESEARAHVARHVLHGVDLDVGAVELARALVWLETSLPWEDLPSLRGFRAGNSLLGATPALAAQDVAARKRVVGRDSVSRETRWCRAFVDVPEASLVHWHLAFPEVFAEARGLPHSRTGANGGFDVVVGNPPFLNQLESESAHDAGVRALLRARFGEASRGYADTAVAFTCLGTELLRAGGRCTLIAPLSLLSARDAEAARRRWAETTQLEALWAATEHVFAEASVYVCAPTLHVSSNRRSRVVRSRDRDFVVIEGCEVDMDALAHAPTWSPLVAEMLGIPNVPVVSAGVVGDEAEVSADFRDQYYGLRGFVSEDGESRMDARESHPPLVTTGLVDLAACLWGAQSTRFDGRRWSAPRVELARLERDGAIGAWARGKLVPKLLLATQTRVLEVVVDEQGAWIPSIPLLSVVAHDATRLWHLAAALSSPPVTALAAATYLGAALSVDAIKLSAAQVRTLPLPPASAAWDSAAVAFRRAQQEPASRREHLRSCAARMCEAYGVPDSARAGLLAWWEARAFGGAGTAGETPRRGRKRR
jgi:hypothetical protein